MKKSILYILIIIIVFSVLGCVKSSDPEEKQEISLESESKDPQIIEIMVFANQGMRIIMKLYWINLMKEKEGR